MNEIREIDHRRDIAAAEGELVWFYTSGAAAHGFAAQNYDFDEPHSELPDIDGKLMKIMFERRGDASKYQRIATTLALTEHEDRATLRAVYEPHGLPEILRARLSLSGSRSTVCLAGLVQQSRAAVRAYTPRRKAGEGLLDFLDRAAHEQQGNASLFASVRQELVTMLDAALTRYASHRPRRVTPVDDGMSPLPTLGLEPGE